jgi:calcineurin-like phosphoesterase family protein
MSTYVSSDLHLGHDREFIWGARYFRNVHEMNAAIIYNINDVVEEDDTLYLLGDLVMGDIEDGRYWLSKINCKNVKFIIGNHDTDNRVRMYEELGFENLGYAAIVREGGWRFYLSHYPTMVGDGSGKKAKYHLWNLCGHCHTKSPVEHINWGCVHVEADAWFSYPVDIEVIKELIIKERVL